MNKIVHNFLHSDASLTNILEQHRNPQDLFEETFYHCMQRFLVFNLPAEEEFIKIDAAIAKGHADKELYLLFLIHMIIFTSYRRKTERSKILKSITENVMAKDTHTTLIIYYKTALLAYLSQTAISNELNQAKDKSISNEFDKIISEILELIDHNNPRYVSIMLNITTHLSVRGKLHKIPEKDILYLAQKVEQKKTPIHLYGLAESWLNNSLCIGDYQKAVSAFEDFRTYFPSDLLEIIPSRKANLQILAGDFNPDHYDHPYFKLYAKGYGLLEKGNIEGANQVYQTIKTQDFSNMNTESHYSGYFVLHVELSAKNKGAARLILQEAEKSRNDYIEDFFWARLYLLENNFSKAHECFQTLLRELKKYKAEPRLLFELRFAKELTNGDLFRLIHQEKIFPIIPSSPSTATIRTTPKQAIQTKELLIGNHSLFCAAKNLALTFAKIREPVLITGETGTGKELIAKMIHEEGDFSKESFLAINCGALTETLLESELFGYEAGAFTGAIKAKKGIFEAAGKGSVFLDEFGDISPKLQASLLRVLESGEARRIGSTTTHKIACRIIIATNANLAEAVKSKTFREDLYFRLRRFDISLPPLRKRSEDIPLLIQHFLNNNQTVNSMPKKASAQLVQALSEYHWPGNIRELKNELERVSILFADESFIEIQHFDFTRLQGFQPSIQKEPLHTRDQKLTRDDHIQAILTKGNKKTRRQNDLKELFERYKELTRAQIIEILDISPATASKDLDILCQEGVIKKITPSKSVRSHYFQYTPPH